MQLGSLELQIFVALVLVLGSAFVALVCDFLKGNNEQLRERNIELRVREDERERLGLLEPLAHPINWLQSLAAMIRNPGTAEAVSGGSAAPAAPQARQQSPQRASAPGLSDEPDLENLTGAATPAAADWADDDRNPQRRHRYDEFKAAAKHQTWATKEELEQLAGRAARIRARHEASHRKLDDAVALSAKALEHPSIALPAEEKPVEVMKEAPRRPKVAELPKLEQVQPPVAWSPQPDVAEVEAVAELAIPFARPSDIPAFEAEAQIPPPMVESPATSAWTFRPTLAQELPKSPEASTATAELVPSVVKPEAPSLVSSLPVAMEVQSETLPFGYAAQDEPAGSAPIVEIWRRPETDADTSVQPAVGETIAYSAPLELSNEAPVVAPPEPVRTRIQAVAVPPQSEAVTEEIVPPPLPVPVQALAVRQPAALPVEPQPVEPPLPALDVAALQKATSDSRPAPARLTSGDSSTDNKVEIPAGLHESAVLSHLIENQSPYSGVVVAIGLNDYETLRDKLASGTDSVAALNKMVLSMLRPQDFACRFQDDEYILIYPGERGSSAQRRLFQVSEKLWDFQLRSLGNLSVMFSWGGLEVTNETLAEAVASARERMYQTKRNRKPSNLEFAVGRKKVVNG